MQTRFESILESTVNTASGMAVSFALGMLVYPVFGFDVSPSQNMWIVVIFTVASFTRSYIWRRWFNGRVVRRVNSGINR